MKKRIQYALKAFVVLFFFFLGMGIARAENESQKAFTMASQGNNLNYLASANSTLINPDEAVNSIEAKQDVTVKGTITDMDGEPLPGVTVLIKGTGTGTTTDVKGNYSIEVADESAVLIFSYVGFVSEEIEVGNQSTISISLLPDLKTLSEVIVVGYGTQKKSDVTGAIAQVTSEEINAIPVQNVLQGVQGKAAGIDISSNTRPGEVGTIRIRGERSLTRNNSPLYVVDGVPLQSGGLEAFNPNDIQSIEVLKDASATAIYGSRAANGVVLVTTKKGQAGRAQFNYNGSVTFERINDLSPNFNAAEYAKYRRDAARSIPKDNASHYRTPYPNPEQDFDYFGTDAAAWESIAAGYSWVDKEALIPQMRPTTPEEQAKWGVNEVPVYDPNKVRTTDWTDYVEQTGVMQNHNISATMGTEKLKAYISGGYLNQTGTNVGQDYKRYNGLVSIDAKPVDWITLGGMVNVSYGIQNYGYAAGGSRGARTIYEAAKGQLPFAVPYDAQGEYIFNPGGSPNIVNPILDGDLVTNERTTLRAFGSFYAELQLMKGLRYKAIFGPDIRNYRNGQFQTAESSLRGGGAASSTNYVNYNQSQQASWTLENLLFYDKTFNENHKIGITLLQSSSFWKDENSGMTATDVPYDSQLWYNIGSTNKGALDSWGSGYSERTLLSYMGRINYSFKDKYLLTASGRWDASSVLAPGHKWDFFPSVALAWKLDQEQFLQNATAIDELKLRVGLGTVGNQAVDPYTVQGPLERLPYVFGNSPASGYVTGNPKGASGEQGSIPNPYLAWEKTEQLNLAVDFGLFENRITGSIDYYIANTSDLLLDKVPLSVTGYSLITKNIGKTRNKGVEIELSTNNISTQNFQWYTDLTFSRNKSEIVELVNGKEDVINELWFIGEPMRVYYDYKKIGIWQTADADEMAVYNDNGADYEAGDIRVEDVNGDNIIDPDNDRQIIGKSAPDWTGGMVNTFVYKNFELSAFVYARWGYTVPGGAVDMQGQFASRKVDYWTPDNPTNAYPKADYLNGGQPTHYSTMNYQDGSFVKVRYISLAYNFNPAVLERARISNLKLYAQVLNPFLFSKTDFLDPDTNFQNGGSNSSATSITSKSLVFGLNLSF